MKFKYYEARLRSNNHIVHVSYMGETTSMKLDSLWRDVDTGNFYLESELDLYGIRKRDIARIRVQVLEEILSKMSEEENPTAFVLKEYNESRRALQDVEQQLQLEDMLDLNNRYYILRSALEQIVERTDGLPLELLSSYRWIIEIVKNALQADTNIRNITKNESNSKRHPQSCRRPSC